MIQAACPGCGQPLSGPDEAAGHMARCPHCSREFLLPARGTVPPPLPPPAAGPSAASWVFGYHDDAIKAYHQGRLMGSIDSMIFGFLSFIPVIGIIFAVMAIPVATKAIGKARQEPGRYSGQAMAIIGLVAASVGLAFNAILILWPVL